MRKILVILTIFVITILGANYLVENYMQKVNIQKINAKKQELLKKKKEEEKLKTQKINQDVSKKIEQLRKKVELKSLIRQGDNFYNNEQNLLALSIYLKALKQIPNDKTIIKKIGDTYFNMHKFPTAFTYYKDLINTNVIDPKKIAITYFYTLPKDRTKLNFEEIYKNIENFKLDKDDTFFYKTAVECIFNKDLCQDKFKKYSTNYKGVNQNILFVKKAFDDYKSFQVKEQYFLDTQIVLALFKARLYGVTNILAKDILKEKPDYLPLIKVLAKGYFEIGNYKEAKKYLLKYNEIDPNDPKVNYMLGIININLHEYILSNIYFTKALKSGHKNKIDISRRLIYNYYLAGNKDKMMQEFKNLIENLDGINENDYNLAIYYALKNNEKLLANKWVNKALQKYPNYDNFYGYKGWIYIEAKDYEKAEYYLNKGLKLNFSNPLINLNLGILEANKGNFLKAKILLKNTINQDVNGEFGKLAEKKLKEVLIEEEKQKEELENNF